MCRQMRLPSGTQILFSPRSGPGDLLKGPGVLLKDRGVLLKDPGVLLKGPGVLLKDRGVLLKDPFSLRLRLQSGTVRPRGGASSSRLPSGPGLRAAGHRPPRGLEREPRVPRLHFGPVLKRGGKKCVKIKIFGTVFLGFSQEIDPGTPLDGPAAPRTSICTKNRPRRPILRPFRCGLGGGWYVLGRTHAGEVEALDRPFPGAPGAPFCEF